MDLLVINVLVFAGVAALGVLIWAVVRHSQKYEARVDAAWQQAAEKLGGTFTPSHGPWYNKSPRNLTAHVDGVSVIADHYTVSSGKSSVTYTRVRCKAAAPQGLQVQVYRKHALSGLGQALGFQDVPTGHRGFDESFTIKCNMPALVPAWLDGPMRGAVNSADNYAFSIDDGVAKAQRTGLEENWQALRAAVRATAILGDRGSRMLDTWRTVARAVGGTLDASHDTWTTGEETTIRTAWRDAVVTVNVVSEWTGFWGLNHELATRFTAKRAKGESFVIGTEEAPKGMSKVPGRLTAYSTNPERTGKRLTEEVVGVLAALPEYDVESDGKGVVLLIPGVVVDSDVALAAIEAVGRLSVEGDFGPYR